MRPYERYSLIAAAGLSVVVHASAVVYFIDPREPLPVSPVQISMTLVKVRPAPAAPVSVAQPRHSPAVAPARQKPAQRLRAVPVSAQLARSAPIEQPAPAPTAETATSSIPPPADVSPVATAAAEEMIQRPLPVLPADTQETYLQQLLAHIDSHKFYPRSARRRGLEGEIEVSFILLEDGSIRTLRVIGGSRELRKAAERAVLTARPMPIPPAATGQGEQVSFSMVFRLG